MSLSDATKNGRAVGAVLAAPLSGGRRTNSGDGCMTESNYFGEDQE